MRENIQRLNRNSVYTFAVLVTIVLVIICAIKESWRDEIYFLFFNPLWPIVLVWIEFILQDNERQVAKENQKKLDSLSGVIRRSIDNVDEQKLVEAIIDAVGTDNLMLLNADKIKEKTINERVAETKVEQDTPENLTP